MLRLKNTCCWQCIGHPNLNVPQFVATAVFSVLDLHPAYKSLQTQVERYPGVWRLSDNTKGSRIWVGAELCWTIIKWLRGDHSKRSQLWERTSLCAWDDAFGDCCLWVRAFHPTIMSAVLVGPMRASFWERMFSACLITCHSSLESTNYVISTVINIFLENAS